MSNTECFSFHPGHHIHHSKIDEFSQPRTMVAISHVMDNAFLVTLNGKTEYWFHHKPERLLNALTRSYKEGIEVTRDKKFLFVYTGEAIERFSMSQENITSCIQVTNNPKVHTRVALMIKDIHAQNIKKLIERGISA